MGTVAGALTDALTDGDLWLGRLVLTRGLALVYLVAFVAALRQFRPLLGEHGLTPISRYTARVPLRRAPSVFHWRSTDRFVAGCCWAGLLLSAAALVGVVDLLPLVGWMAVWAVLWALYLSLVNVGQVWYGFGWESLLVEAGFLAIFLGPAHVAPPVLVLWLVRWLLVRLEVGAGLIKLRGDRCWRDLTCLDFHHETQPMPGPLSRGFHRLPTRVHQLETLGNHVTQLVLVLGLLAPQPVAGAAALVVVVTQGWLVVSGNFAWLNALTLVLALSVLPPGWTGAVLPVPAPDDLASPAWFVGLTLVLTVLVALLSVRPVVNMLSPRQRMNASFDPLRLVNTYGAFGSVSRVRHEVVVQGTDNPGAARGVPREASGDGTGLGGPDDDPRWRAYEFRAKPGDPYRRPPQVAPYHLRLDWLMWFVALSPAYGRGWFTSFLDRLLAGDRAVLGLLRSSPFPPGAPPLAVRALVYRYRFTTREERRATGAWWHRTYVGELVPPRTRAAGRA